MKKIIALLSAWCILFSLSLGFIAEALETTSNHGAVVETGLCGENVKYSLYEDGNLVIGEHTCIIRATDNSGNVSEISLQVIVGEKDDVAPTLSWAPDNIYAPVGAKPDFNVIATDNKDEIEVELTWSDGALDKRGRLLEGEHTLTVSASDLTGNKTEKVITVFVGVNDVSDWEIIEDTK